MSVASHLGIRLAEYDRRIRTFIPHYEEMLDVAAAAVPPRARTIVDLGIGTGALAARCRDAAPRARIVGIDSDAAILAIAARRLKGRTAFVRGDFLSAALPSCDVVVASFALHHIATIRARLGLYGRVRSALRRGGRFITVDCHPASLAGLAKRQRDAWRDHLARTYGRARAEAFLREWAHEDTYVPLEAELGVMKRRGFAVELLWRKDAFAVLMAGPARGA